MISSTEIQARNRRKLALKVVLLVPVALVLVSAVVAFALYACVCLVMWSMMLGNTPSLVPLGIGYILLSVCLSVLFVRGTGAGRTSVESLPPVTSPVGRSPWVVFWSGMLALVGLPAFSIGLFLIAFNSSIGNPGSPVERTALFYLAMAAILVIAFASSLVLSKGRT
jgi:hypothetical protein